MERCPVIVKGGLHRVRVVGTGCVGQECVAIDAITVWSAMIISFDLTTGRPVFHGWLPSKRGNVDGANHPGCLLIERPWTPSSLGRLCRTY